jgi:hypothetical protein
MPTIRIILDDGADAYDLQGRNGTVLHQIDPDLATRMVRSGHAVIVRDTTPAEPSASSKTSAKSNTTNKK